MLKIKNVILEISFRNDILLCNIKKGCLAILVHVFVVVLVFAAVRLPPHLGGRPRHPQPALCRGSV